MDRARAQFRAYVCRELGDYRDLAIEAVALPNPGPGEVLIENRAFAIGFPDLLMVQGKYQHKPELPFTPGAESSGVVLAAGEDVAQFSVGQRVMATARVGACAEAVVVKADACFALPALFDFAAGAGFLNAYRTAYVALVVRGALKAGETVLVHGAAGGVGLAAVELGKLLGARVIATGSSAQKLEVAKQKGADEVINYSEGTFREAVKALTGGRGADVIFDPVGGDVFDESLRCLAPFGRILVIGFTSGRIPSVAVNYALIKQISIVGVRAGEHGRIDPAGGRQVNEALLAYAGAGALSPHIHARVPFPDLARAFDEIVARRVIGRMIVEID